MIVAELYFNLKLMDSNIIIEDLEVFKLFYKLDKFILIDIS